MLKKKIMFLLCTSLLAVTAFADITFSWKVSGPFVKATKLVRNAELQIEGDGEQISQFNGTITLAEGITIDPAKAVVTTDTSFLIANTNKNAVRVVDGGKKINLAFANALSVGSYSILAGPTAKTLVTLEVELDETSANLGVISNGFGFFTVKVYDPETNTTKNGTFTSSNLDFDYVDSFAFKTVDAALAQTTENVNLTIEATDANLFEAKAWSDAAGDMVATAAVGFKNVAIKDGSVNAGGIVINPGTVVIQDGKIVYTPTQYFFGTFTIIYTAESTDPALVGEVAGQELDIKVNGVPSPLGIADFNVPASTENDKVTITFTLTNYDGEALPTNKDDYLLEGFEGVAIDTVQVVDNAVTITSTVIPYSAVIHPNSAVIHPNLTQVYTITITVKNKTLDGTNSMDVTIGDTNRPFIAAQGLDITPAVAYTTNDLTATITDEPVDPDPEDVVVTRYVWTSDTAKEFVGKTLPADQTAKGETWTVAIMSSSFNEPEKKTSEKAITINNSAPVANYDETKRLFIQKDGADEFATMAMTMQDPDGDLFEVKELASAHGATVEVVTDNGTVTGIKYTVRAVDTADPNAEYFGDNADTVTFRVYDGTDYSKEYSFKVDYRLDPPPVVVAFTAPEATYNEVDNAGNAVVVEASITVKDDDTTTVVPSGVSEITWAVAIDGLDAANFTLPALDFAPIAVVEGAAQATSTVRVTLGYDILKGKNRPVNHQVKLTATFKDGVGSVDSKEFVFTVVDVDRAPQAPKAITLTPSSNPLITGSTVDAQVVEANAPVDLDGDDVLYSYRYTVTQPDSTQVQKTEADVNAANKVTSDALKKGDKIVFEAKATSKRAADGNQIESNFVASDTLTVENSAPAVVTKKTADAPLVIEEAQQANVQHNFNINVFEDTDVATYTDIDEAVGRETIVITIDDANIADFASVQWNGVSLIVKPKPFMNTFGLANEDLPTFKVTVTDDQGAADQVEVFVRINPVNEDPEIAKSDIYVIPGEIDGTEKESKPFKVTMGKSADEIEHQTLTAAAILGAVIDDDGILDGAPTPVLTGDAKSFTIKYTVKADAVNKLGKFALFTVQVTDSEGGTGTAEIKIVIGATPWYPVYDIQAPDSEDYSVAVVITDEDGNTYQIVPYNMETVTPEDYFRQNIPGFLSGENLTFDEYKWTPEEGLGEQIKDGMDNPISTPIQVPEYGTPDEPTVTYDDANSSLSVSAPLGASVVIEIINANGDVVATIPHIFTPGMDGMIVPEADIPVDLAPGVYTVKIGSTNPEGDFEDGDGTPGDGFLQFTVTGGGNVPEWPTDGFEPSHGYYIYVPGNKSDVTFSWPIHPSAKSYEITIIDGEGYVFKTLKSNANTVTATDLPLDNYTWQVAAIGTGEVSATMSFSVFQKMQEGLEIAIVNVNDNLDGIGIFAINTPIGFAGRFDIVYYNTETQKWFNIFPDTQQGSGYFIIPSDQFNGYQCQAGYYILIRPYGSTQEYNVYLITEAYVEVDP